MAAAAPTNELVIVNPDLKEITVQVLRDGFALFNEKLTIGINDPESPAQLPFVGVNLGTDMESVSHIGDSISDETVDEEGRVYAGIGTVCQQQVEVKLWCNNAAQRDRLGKLLKVVLFWGRGNSAKPGLFTTTPGLESPRIGGGADEGISVTSEQYPPHALYTRTYVLTSLTDLIIQEPVVEPVEQFLIEGSEYQIGSPVGGEVIAVAKP